jgi:hypothetical protein
VFLLHQVYLALGFARWPYLKVFPSLSPSLIYFSLQNREMQVENIMLLCFESIANNTKCKVKVKLYYAKTNPISVTV